MSFNQPYPQLIVGGTQGLEEVVRRMVQERLTDLVDWDNLPQRFPEGMRKVAKVPSASSDIATTDNEGDVNWDTSYLYLCVNNSGSLVWRRASLSSW